MIDLYPNETFFAMGGLFLVVFVALHFLVFKPTLRLVDERKKRTEYLKTNADSLQTETKSLVEQYEQRLVKARGEAAKEREAILNVAHHQERAIMERAREENEAALNKMKSQLAKERDEAVFRLKQQAEVLAKNMVDKILDRNAA